MIKLSRIFITVLIVTAAFSQAGDISNWDQKLSGKLEGSNHRPFWNYVWESVSLSTPLIEVGIAANEMNISRERAGMLGSSLLATQLTVGAGKYMIKRTRPERTYRPRLWNTRITPSFPSGHSASSAAAAAFLSTSRPEFTTGSVVYALLSGYSQVYVGNHYVSDVLAGWAIGSLIGWSTAKFVTDKNENSGTQGETGRPTLRITISIAR